ncbi:MAG TPA: carbon monoxide dehydrogenase subunit G [Terriglobia bacterium]|nr:carbon monoxide dehydrogenase subunit G [Terriglobia bacterium]
MKLEGAFTVAAPRSTVWENLMNPDVLARALPGCEKMEPNADGSYQAELRVGIGAIKGTYSGRVEILDPVPLEHYRMKVEGKGTGGFVRGEGTLTLSDSGPATAGASAPARTIISYRGDAHVGGLIASVGQRLLQGAAQKIVGQFFEAFAREVLSASQASGAAPASGPVAPSS